MWQWVKNGFAWFHVLFEDETKLPIQFVGELPLSDMPWRIVVFEGGLIAICPGQKPHALLFNGLRVMESWPPGLTDRTYAAVGDPTFNELKVSPTDRRLSRS